MTIAVGSPASAIVLYLYTKSIKKFGSRVTLRISHCACIVMFLSIFLYCGRGTGFTRKAAAIVFYALREIYISLLSSQHWAFISTSLDKSTSSYLVSFSGVVSVASAIGGCTVEQLVELSGMKGLLFTALVATIIGLICAETANIIIIKHQELKALEISQRRTPRQTPNTTPKSSTDNLQKLFSDASGSKSNIKDAVSNEGTKKLGFWQDSWNLIRNHSVLQLLFFEAITHQTCTNMLHIMFHNGLRYSTMANDFKAKLVGRFFATVNIAACLLQVFVVTYCLMFG